MLKPIAEERPPAGGKGSWLALFLAAILGLFGFVTLAFLTLGYFTPVVVIGGLIFAVAGFHYLVWGWWLDKVLEKDRDVW